MAAYRLKIPGYQVRNGDRNEKVRRICKKYTGFSGTGNYFPRYYDDFAGSGRTASGNPVYAGQVERYRI